MIPGPRRIWLILTLAALSITCAGYFYFLAAPSLPRAVTFEVRPGAGAAEITGNLARNGLIRSRTGFRVYLLITGKTNSFKKGVYEIPAGTAVPGLVSILTSGVTRMISFTVPEGFNNRQIGDLLAEKGLVASREGFLKAAADPGILSKYRIPARSVEGYLFPETYTFAAGVPVSAIIRAMLEEFLSQAKELGLPADPVKRHELVILASIVEREAQLKEERSLIASVFANRMRDNYPLESCATIQYTFPKQKKRIYFKDLEVDSPYNTYRNRGLPPTPISSPGKAALEAALRPAPTDYRFFVLKGDGSHHFSKDYREHAAMKRKYLGGE